MRRGVKRNRQADRVLGIPLLNALALLHRRRPVPPPPFRRIGFMSSPALGDTLLASGPLQDLRAAFPEAHITHICMPQNLAAAEILPGAAPTGSRVDPQGSGNVPNSHSDASTRSIDRLVVQLTRPDQAARAVRDLHLDVLVDLTSWQRLTALLTLLSGARYTVGFRSPGQHRSRGYDRTVQHRRDLHEVDNFRALLRGSGLLPRDYASHEPAVQLPPTCTAEPFAAEPAIVAFHAWASGQRAHLREWPEDRWITLARRLAAQPAFTPVPLFVVTGAPSDAPRSHGLVTRLRSAGLRAEPFVSPDGFCSLTRLLRRCGLVVSVNTGVMHLAAIVGAPTVSINGPNAGFRWGPRGPRVRNVQALDGSGGYLHLGFEHPRQPAPAMERTSVEQVLAAATELLAASSSSRSAAPEPIEVG